MKGTVSFHPVSLAFFDELAQPLLAGRRVNPEAYLDEAIRLRRSFWGARRYQDAIQAILDAAEPPRPEPGAGILRNIKARLDRFDHREDELTCRVRSKIEPDLHLYGRPFFITEGSAARVAERIDEFRGAEDENAIDSLALEQLVRMDPQLAKGVELAEAPDLTSDASYRSDLLAGLKELYDLAHAVRRGDKWGPASGARRPALEVLQSDVPGKAMWLHARSIPFWVGRDVDGIETICRAAGVEPPGFLVPPWRLFAETFEEFPGLKDALHVELQSPGDVAAFVAPDDVPDLVEFLNANGSRIIQVATRHGEGETCTTLLRKIRECAAYAERHNMGYLEASGIVPPDLNEEAPVEEEVDGT